MKQEVTIPLYVRKVQLSNARNKKYYEEGKKLPKAAKYYNPANYQFVLYPNKIKYLTDMKTKERVVANPKAAGTPGWTTINGQNFYNGTIREHTRAKVVNTIKEQFTPYIEQLTPLKPEDYPIRIKVHIKDVLIEGTSYWDLDNRIGPYLKCSQDILTGNHGKSKKIIEDDDTRYLRSIHLDYTEIADNNQRELKITIESI
jgi:hypothetical protein